MSSPRGSSIPAEVREVFERIDTDRNGTIDRHELLVRYTLQPSRYFGDDAVSEALREMGADKSGSSRCPHSTTGFRVVAVTASKARRAMENDAGTVRFCHFSLVTNFAASLGAYSGRRTAMRDAPSGACGQPEGRCTEYILSGRQPVSLLTGRAFCRGWVNGMYDTLRPELLTATPAERTMMAANPTHVVSWDLFRGNPLPYLSWTVRLSSVWPAWKPTATPFSMRLLHDKGLFESTRRCRRCLISRASMGESFCTAMGRWAGRVRMRIKRVPQSGAYAGQRYLRHGLHCASSSTPLLCKACGAGEADSCLYGSPLPKSFADAGSRLSGGEATERMVALLTF